MKVGKEILVYLYNGTLTITIKNLLNNKYFLLNNFLLK